MGAGLLLPLYPGHYIYPEEPLTRLDAAYAILMPHDIEFDYESTSALWRAIPRSMSRRSLRW